MTDTEERPADEARMSLIDHLTELRKRLVVSFVAIAIGVIIGWLAFDWIIDLLIEP